ncbi:MAG: response regulator, partial [Chloroflexota bacterium]
RYDGGGEGSPMLQSKGMVLIVDDEESICALLRAVVEHAGYAATTAGSGEEAMTIAAQKEFDVVLLDVRMSGMSGLNVLAELHRSYPDTSVVMATAVADVQTVITAMRAGAYDYVIKPFDLEEVVLIVDKARERRVLVIQNRMYQRHLAEMVEEQRVRLQQQFKELVQSLAREHAVHYEIETLRSKKGRGAVPPEEMPPELRKPFASVQEFAAAILRLMEHGKAPKGP